MATMILPVTSDTAKMRSMISNSMPMERTMEMVLMLPGIIPALRLRPRIVVSFQLCIES